MPMANYCCYKYKKQFLHFCNFLINYMITDKFIFFQISQKGKTIVDFIYGNDFAEQRLFRISHILEKKANFFNIKNHKIKIYILSKNFSIRMCRAYLAKQCFI